jgi:patatin-like phospholipase/acyl hydrolase
MASFTERIQSPAPKRLLALDGGGIRGIITLHILERIEALLRTRHGNPRLVLGNYFDFIGGTSSGAIIATCLSLGYSVAEITSFYVASGKAMFDRSEWIRRFRHKYEDERLAQQLKSMIGADIDLGSEVLQTLLLIVMRNATNDSPWPLINNPLAKYNEPLRPDSNLRLPLWQLVRASTAAPTFFPPEVVRLGSRDFVFVDGGLTIYNNPAFLMFRMATLEPYRVRWAAGEDMMLVVSVGTGSSIDANINVTPDAVNLLFNATSVPSALIFAAMNEQDTLCRVFGRTRCGEIIDREIGNLIDSQGPFQSPLFSYVRYNVDLSYAGLGNLGLSKIEPQNVLQLDSVEHIEELAQIGRAAAHQQIRDEHFAGFDM